MGKMKNIFKNDKTTAKDELEIFLFMLALLTIGVVITILVMQGIISKDWMSFGVIFITIFMIMIPSLLFRLMENDKDAGKNTDK